MENFLHLSLSLTLPVLFEVAKKPTSPDSVKVSQALAVWDLDPKHDYIVQVEGIKASPETSSMVAKPSLKKGTDFIRACGFQFILCYC